MADDNISLRSAVEKAAAEQGIQETPENEEIQPVKQADTNNTEENNKEEAPADKEEKESEGYAPDPEIEEALSFYRALRDPSQQNQIIAELAQRAGLLQQNQQITPSQEKRYGDLLNEILGEEYPDLKDKLGPIFQAFERENDQKLLGLRAEIEQERRQKAVSEFESEFGNFISENKVTEDEAAKMLKEIELLPPTAGKNGHKLSLSAYLGRIHRLVVGEKKDLNKEIKRTEKIHQNLKERSTNLSSDISEDRIKKGSSLPSIKEAIRAASEGIEFDKD